MLMHRLGRSQNERLISDSLNFLTYHASEMVKLTYFDKVWNELTHNIGEVLRARILVKNEYGGIEPWYELPYHGATITTGWRKNVINIRVETPIPFPIEGIQAIAAEDKVTFSATRGKVTKTIEEISTSDEELKRHSRWFPSGTVELDVPGDDQGATRVVIHAWNQEKVIEYLTLLCRSVRDSADSTGLRVVTFTGGTAATMIIADMVTMSAITVTPCSLNNT
jgi:hypothetical protein